MTAYVTGTRHPVVLIPGYRDNIKKVAPLADYLRGQGFETLPLAPQPSDGSVGIDELAGLLADQIEAELGPDQPIDLFGFSMGGLVARYYVQRLGGAARVKRLVTLATPHLGSWTAYGVPAAPAILQMRPHSPFLQTLNAGQSVLDQLGFVALWTPFDLSVTPAHYAFLPGRPARRVLSPFHGMLVYDPFVQRTIAQELAALPEGAPAHHASQAD